LDLNPNMPVETIFIEAENLYVSTNYMQQNPIDFRLFVRRLLSNVRMARGQTNASQDVKKVPNDFGKTFIFKKSITDLPRCTICLEEFKSHEKVRQLHGTQCSYHKRCLKVWFKHKSTCPNCNLDCCVANNI